MSGRRRLVVPPSVVFREVAGEAVLLDLETQRYFSLDPIGTRMWALLAEHGRLEPVRERLLAEYEVAPEVLELDLAELVERLVGQGLARWEEEPGESPGGEGSGGEAAGDEGEAGGGPSTSRAR